MCTGISGTSRGGYFLGKFLAQPVLRSTGRLDVARGLGAPGRLRALEGPDRLRWPRRLRLRLLYRTRLLGRAGLLHGTRLLRRARPLRRAGLLRGTRLLHALSRPTRVRGPAARSRLHRAPGLSPLRGANLLRLPRTVTRPSRLRRLGALRGSRGLLRLSALRRSRGLLRLGVLGQSEALRRPNRMRRLRRPG
ncbi:hypothetical protein [Streptomyces siamensis]